MNKPTKTTPRGRPRHDSGLARWHGGALRARRTMAGVPVRELADALGVGKTTVCRWELSIPGQARGRDRNTPTREQVSALAKFFKCPRVAFSRAPKIQ